MLSRPSSRLVQRSVAIVMCRDCAERRRRWFVPSRRVRKATPAFVKTIAHESFNIWFVRKATTTRLPAAAAARSSSPPRPSWRRRRLPAAAAARSSSPPRTSSCRQLVQRERQVRAHSRTPDKHISSLRKFIPAFRFSKV